jgi:4-diphosphocytidyl-2-C-methyl-D-erythritol kinase
VTVTLRADGEYTVDCNNPSVPQNASNLAIKAAVAFEKELGTAYGADIYVDKQIPMAAGLAGGSADAAAVLKAMNELCGNPFTVQKLCEIGSGLGSDVPFCIACGTKYADGFGDKLHSFSKMPDCYFVVACAGEGVSTPWAYSALDAKHRDFRGDAYTPRTIEPLAKAMKKGSIVDVSQNIYNIFESVICPERPMVNEIKETLLDNGALSAMMSGSGPSVFGIFKAKEIADAASEALSRKGICGFVCEPICERF